MGVTLPHSTAARIVTYSDSEGEDEEPLKVRAIPELPSPRDGDSDADGNIIGAAPHLVPTHQAIYAQLPP